ncbi:MAG: hypothetical protein ACYSX0_02790 [Planctomycetota bacterium]|jgi:hypothetical protein
MTHPLRAGVALTCLILLGGCLGDEDSRPGEEVWLLDFESHRLELQVTLAPFGLDSDDVALRTLELVREDYAGLPIRFELGDSPGLGESHACVRRGEDDVLGRGFLDLGNTRVDHMCTRQAGLLYGTFIDNVVDQIVNQSAPVTTERVARTLAVVLSHEIGHALGLTHSLENNGLGDIMNGSGILDVFCTDYSFTAEHIELLERNLLP